MIQWSYNISDAMKKVGFTSVTLTSMEFRREEDRNSMGSKERW
jgi:hypothetical protein